MFRPFPTTILALACTAAQAQTPVQWEQIKAELLWRKGGNGQFRLVLADRTMVGKPWSLTDDAIRLLLSRAIGFMVLGPGQFATVGESFPEAAKARWFVLGPQGTVLASGERDPDAPAILAAMRSSGWRPAWEARAELLRDHPQWGDLVAEEFMATAGEVLFRARNQGRETPRTNEELAKLSPEAWDEAGARRVRRALEAMLAVPDWEQAEAYFFFASLGALSECPQLRPVLGEVVERLKALIRQSPSDYRAWETLGTMLGALPADFVDKLRTELEPLPGWAFPSDSAVDLHCRLLSRDKEWQRLADDTAGFWAHARALASSREATPYASREGIGFPLIMAIGVPRIRALLSLGKVEDALAQLAEFKDDAGSRWSQVAKGFSERIMDRNGRDLVGIDRIQEFLKSDPAPLRPAVRPLPYRFVFTRANEAGPRLGDLKQHPSFEAWSEAELSWRPLGEDERGKLENAPPPTGGATWMLLQGSRVLEWGQGEVKPDAMAAALARQGVPYLQRLRALLDRQPDRLDAQEVYLTLLLEKLPSPRIELELLRRLPVWRVGLPGPERLKVGRDREAWSAAALKLLPQIESDLEPWPGSWRQWSRWMFWSQFHPRPTPPATLLRRLPYLPSSWVEQSALNVNVVSLVMWSLRERKAWRELSDWCAAVWELDYRRWTQAILSRPVHLKSNYVEPQGELRQVRNLVLQPLEEALIQLGETARLKALQGELKAMGYKDPGPRPKD
ncbi:MAG: hypothetical protein U0P81_04010 [Holophagaceae bacterium]